MRYITIAGVKHLWRDILRLRREQRKESRQPQQETLFEIHDDIRPALERNASDRFANPSLFDGWHDE